MNGEKYCPLFRGCCSLTDCAIWDPDKDRCSIISLAEGANRMREIECELYEIRKQLEDGSRCHAGF